MPATDLRLYPLIKPLAVAGLVAATLAGSAFGQVSSATAGGAGGKLLVTSNAVLDSVTLTGAASLPLGLQGADVPSNVTLTSTRAGHNSVRSNHSQPAADTETNFPDDYDGDELLSDLLWGLDFDLTFTPASGSFDPAFGDSVTVSLDSPLWLAPAEPTSILFDADAPDYGFNQLGPGGATSRVSALFEEQTKKFIRRDAAGAETDFGEILPSPSSVSLRETLGSGVLAATPDGYTLDQYSISLSLSGTLNGHAFSIVDLTGTLSEEAAFTATFVPEPTGGILVLLAMSAAATCRLR